MPVPRARWQVPADFALRVFRCESEALHADEKARSSGSHLVIFALNASG